MSGDGDGRASLIKDAEEYVRYAYRQANIWGVIYYVERSLLIVFSVLTSAEALNSLPDLANFKPVFGLMVLLLTAFDVWLKPETKYKGYYQANDAYDELRQSITLFLRSDNEAGLRDAYAEMKRINERLRAIL